MHLSSLVYLQWFRIGDCDTDVIPRIQRRFLSGVFPSLRTVFVHTGEEKVLAECSDTYMRLNACASDPGKERKKEKKKSHPGQMVRPH